MSTDPSIADRMATLKENSNQSPRSEATNSSPLSLFLAIYNKAEHDCYIDYMEGAKALHSWLTLQGTVPLELGVIDLYLKVPKLLTSYSLQELTKILAPEDDLKRSALVRAAIFTTLCKDIF